MFFGLGSLVLTHRRQLSEFDGAELFLSFISFGTTNSMIKKYSVSPHKIVLYSAVCLSLGLSDSAPAATVDNLSEAAESVGGESGGNVDPGTRPVVQVCVGLNAKAAGQATPDPTTPPTNDQIAANLSADENDLLRRCADVIQAGGLGIQADQADATDNAEAAVALRQIAPDEIAAQGTTSVNAVNSQQNNVAARISALQSGLRGLSLGQLSLNVDGSKLAGDQLQKLVGGAAGDGDRRIGMFISGDIASGEKDTTSREAGFDFDTQMLTVGVDYFLNDSSFVGLALGVSQIEMDLDDAGGGLDTDSVGISLYGSVFRKNNFYINGFFDYTSSDHDSQRNMNYTLDETQGGCCVVTETGRVTVLQSANGSTEGDQTTLSINMGFDYNKGALSYGPTLDLTYSSLTIDGFSESMSNPEAVGRGLALTYKDQDIDSVRSILGFHVSHASSQNWGIFSKQLRLGWHHEFEDDEREIRSFYSFDPAQTEMILKADAPDTDFYSVSIDLSAGFANGRSAFISYSTLAGLDDVSLNQISAGLRLEF